MPQQPRRSIYEIEDPRTGTVYEVESDRMPTEADVSTLLDSVRGARRPHAAEDFMEPEPDRGSAIGRFASNAAELVNPINIAKGVYHAATDLHGTTRAILSGQADQFRRAGEDFGQGRYLEAAGRAAAGVLPIVGPLAAEAGEQIASGDVAGGFGKATGLLAGPAALRGVTSAAAKAIPARAATRLEAGAAGRVADVMSPRANTNVGRRMGNTAERIAPELAKDAEITGNWSRQGMQQTIGGKLDDSIAMLDEAADARLSALTFETEPILAALRSERAKLTAQTVEASKPVRAATKRESAIVDEGGKPIEVTDLKAKALGKDVVPGPSKPRVAQIDQAIAEIEALGPVANYEPLRRIRQSYDGPAKAVYNPSMTADFLAKTGESQGAASVTGVLREHLAQFDPQTAAANAQYSLYKSATDIMKAGEEIERVRPKVGRQLMSRLTGTILGGQQAGAAGAVGGFVLGPVVDQALSAGVTTKLQTAKLMTDLAAAIRKGDVGRATSINFKIRQLVKQAEAVRSRETDSASPAARPLLSTAPAGSR